MTSLLIVEGGLSNLQYANDIIIFLEYDLENALNIKLVICIFLTTFGPKTSFH
jgi:hypothetical protein